MTYHDLWYYWRIEVVFGCEKRVKSYDFCVPGNSTEARSSAVTPCKAPAWAAPKATWSPARRPRVEIQVMKGVFSSAKISVSRNLRQSCHVLSCCYVARMFELWLCKNEFGILASLFWCWKELVWGFIVFLTVLFKNCLVKKNHGLKKMDDLNPEKISKSLLQHPGPPSTRKCTFGRLAHMSREPKACHTTHREEFIEKTRIPLSSERFHDHQILMCCNSCLCIFPAAQFWESYFICNTLKFWTGPGRQIDASEPILIEDNHEGLPADRTDRNDQERESNKIPKQTQSNCSPLVELFTLVQFDMLSSHFREFV